MAVGLERAHAEFLGQGEGLLVMGFGLLDLRRVTRAPQSRQEAQGIRLVARVPCAAGQVERLARRVPGLLRGPPATGLAEPCDDGGPDCASRSVADGFADRLLQQRRGLGDAPCSA